VADRPALAQYCQSYADFVECRTQVEHEGWTVEAKFGRAVNPTVKAMHAAQDRWLKGIANLGLSPADRAKIEVEPVRTTTTGGGAYMTGSA
jgi:P27 family predicted phage terminase small subunit